jgi:outer membrane lipoprotein-sorting protein/predicted aspartyl protease
MRIRLFLLSLVILVSSVYCFAQEKAVPEPVLEGLRQQMKQLDTLKAEYTVNGILGQSQKQIKTDVSYIKSGGKYSMLENAYEGDEQTGETKTIYDGISIKELNFNKKENRSLGTIHSKDMYDVLITRNDIRNLFLGFVFVSRQFDENLDTKVFKNLGTESVGGHDCIKIVMISPYKPDQKAYDYMWIGMQDDKYFLLKALCLIEDDPNQLLYEKRYDYIFPDTYPFPRKIYYERFEIDDKGNRTPYYKLNVAVEDFKINVPISESEFVYSFPEGTLVNGMTASVNPKTISDPNWPNIKTPKKVAELNQPVIDNRTEFPIGGGCGAILIPVHIQGKEYSFVLDTGASNTILDTSLRDLLGKPKSMQRVQTAGNPMVMQIFESPLIQIGPFNIPKGSDVSCIDLSMASMVDGRNISGILGMDFLKNHVIRIDFDKYIFSFLVQDDIDTSASGQEFNLTYNSLGLPQVKGQLLDNIYVEFIIDCGNNYFGDFDKDTFEKIITRQDTKISETLVVAASGPQKQREIRVKSLKIGNFDYKDTIFGESNYNCLGIEFLNRHVVTLDFPKMKMYLSKSNRFEKIDEDDMSGLHLLLISGKVVVHSIDKNSPADKNGITTGDVIVKIDGKNATDIEISQVRLILRSGEGKEITLTIGHNGQLREITLVLEKKI